MNDATIRDLLHRLDAIERRQVAVRMGVITDTSPLAVALGGSEDSFAARAVQGIPLAVDDVVAVLTFGNDMLILGAPAPADTGWVPLTPASGWASSGGIAYRVTDRIVYLRGTLTTIGSNGSTAFTLPVGARPGLQLFPHVTVVSNVALNANLNIGVGGVASCNYEGTPTSIGLATAPFLAEN